MDNCRPLWLGNLQHSVDTSSYQPWSLDQTYQPSSSTFSPKDNLSVTYTSDYGSYSSQESNHSGNASLYSNLLDCEEVLHTQHIPYDLSSPAVTVTATYNPDLSNMAMRKPKPLPPPRTDSRRRFMYDSFSGLNNGRAAVEQKTSLDDLNITKDKKLSKDSPSSTDQSTPSYATLPRKKKLVMSDSHETKSPSHSTTHVTWMKDIVQKEAALKASQKKSEPKDGTTHSKTAVHGILKNKNQSSSPTAATKQAENPGYINRNTVQKILDQQRKASAKSRHSAKSNQFYKSMPSLQSTSSKTQNEISSQANLYKPWEHNSKASSIVPTAQVLGVIEPSQSGSHMNSDAQPLVYQHAKQNSTETEFEFPPPPSENDIANIMSAASVSTQLDRLELSTRKKENETLNCDKDSNSERDVRGSSLKAFIRTGTAVSRTKPTVPVKPQPHTRPSPPHAKPQQTMYPSKYQSTPQLKPVDQKATTKQTEAIVDDIVIPPPPEFQESKPSDHYQQQEHTYGDYEMLSPTATYSFQSKDKYGDFGFNRGTIAQPNMYTQSNPSYQSHDKALISNRNSHKFYSQNGRSDLNGYHHVHTSYTHNNQTSHYHQYSTEL